MSQTRLRPAVLEDAEMVFRWRNDPFILTRGSSQRAVPWDEHLNWFVETMKSARRKMLILLKDEQPIGQVRFDRFSPAVCIISVYLLRDFTGKGYGVHAIRDACTEIFRLWDVQTVIACVRSENAPARSAFLKAGFVEEESHKGFCPEAHFTLSVSRPTSTSRAKGNQQDVAR